MEDNIIETTIKFLVYKVVALNAMSPHTVTIKLVDRYLVDLTFLMVAFGRCNLQRMTLGLWLEVIWKLWCTIPLSPCPSHPFSWRQPQTRAVLIWLLSGRHLSFYFFSSLSSIFSLSIQFLFF